MRIIVSEHYLPGTIITIKLPLNNNTVSVKCKVVWVMKKKSAFWIGLDFVDLGMLDQDYIVQHVFKKMRTQMADKITIMDCLSTWSCYNSYHNDRVIAHLFFCKKEDAIVK